MAEGKLVTYFVLGYCRVCDTVELHSKGCKILSYEEQ